MFQGTSAALATFGSFLAFMAWVYVWRELALFPSEQEAAVVLLFFLATGFLLGLGLGWLWEARRKHPRW